MNAPRKQASPTRFWAEVIADEVEHFADDAIALVGNAFDQWTAANVRVNETPHEAGVVQFDFHPVDAPDYPGAVRVRVTVEVESVQQPKSAMCGHKEYLDDRCGEMTCWNYYTYTAKH
jgi:hypothetical protein